MDDSLKNLFDTDLFSDVRLERDGSTVIVRVVENPIVNRIVFEGNKRISDDILSDEIRLEARSVFTKARVQDDVQTIISLYRKSGRFAVRVEPKMVRLAQNRVNLIFEVFEGDRTEVSRISFVGNRRFSDPVLRDTIATKESAFWRFLSSNDSYDADRLAFDRELLRRKYLKEGYADIRTVSAVAELTPDLRAFHITFTLEEGARYKIRDVTISNRVKGIDDARLAQAIEVRSGDWYDAEAVEDTVDNLSEAASRLGHAFVQVVPKIEKDRTEHLLDIVFDVRPGPRVYVERIDIRGNLRTRDHVIRREFEVIEGDPFNSEKIRRSQRNLRNLGFFGGVDMRNLPGSEPDRTEIEVDVEEQSTGEIAFGVGFTSDGGLLGDISLAERNLLGKGQYFRIRTRAGQRTNEVDLSFTEPYFLDRKLRSGFDLFYSDEDFQRESSYDLDSRGFRLRADYVLGRDLTQRWRYELRQDHIGGISEATSPVIKDLSGKSTASIIGHGLSYDTRDSRFDPKTGMLVTLDNDFAGLGGSEKFIRNRASIRNYDPVGDELTLAAGVSIGHIFSFDKSVRIFDRFFLGGNNLRGFEFRGVGPRDEDTDDAIGGKWFYSGSVGLWFPLGVAKEIGLRGRAFSDFGSLDGVDEDLVSIRRSSNLRASVGLGLSWQSPIGPMNIDFAKAVARENYDRLQTFHFSFGTNF